MDAKTEAAEVKTEAKTTVKEWISKRPWAVGASVALAGIAGAYAGYGIARIPVVGRLLTGGLAAGAALAETGQITSTGPGLLAGIVVPEATTGAIGALGMAQYLGVSMPKVK